MKKPSVYHSMKAHDLARITRERGLDKPKVITLSEWADVLEADDVKRAKAQAADMPDTDVEETPKRTQDKTPTASKSAKGKE